MSSLNNIKGFTLVEMMITIMISLVLIAGAYGTYIAQNRSFFGQEKVSEVNNQSKIAFDMIVNDIRSAGFGNLEDLAANPVNGVTSIVSFTNSDTGPDTLTLVGGFRRVGIIEGCAGCDPNQIQLGSLIRADIINDADRKHISMDGVFPVTVLSIADAPIYRIDRNVMFDFDPNRPIYLIEDVTYCLTANGTLRRLRRNADPATCTGVAETDKDTIAENIEDFQVAFAVDADGDGRIDDQDGDGIGGVHDPDDFISNPPNPGTIRAVRLNILARTDMEDPNYLGMGKPPEDPIEDHAIPAATDGFKRRWWQSVVILRAR